MIIFPGKKLDYECNYCEKPKNEQDFMTAVEFSAENPYGKAVALLNLKSGFLKVFFLLSYLFFRRAQNNNDDDDACILMFDETDQRRVASIAWDPISFCDL